MKMLKFSKRQDPYTTRWDPQNTKIIILHRRIRPGIVLFVCFISHWNIQTDRTAIDTFVPTTIWYVIFSRNCYPQHKTLLS